MSLIVQLFTNRGIHKRILVRKSENQIFLSLFRTERFQRKTATSLVLARIHFVNFGYRSTFSVDKLVDFCKIYTKKTPRCILHRRDASNFHILI